MCGIKQKIIFVIPSLAGGGAERVIVHLTKGLNPDKYKVLVVIFENKIAYRNYLPDDVEIHCLEKKNRWDFIRMVILLRKIIYREKPSVVISFLDYANIATILASFLLKKKFKLLISVRNNLHESLSGVRWPRTKRFLIKFTYKKVDRIIAVSEGCKKILINEFQITPEKIITIYNPVPVERIIEKCKEDVCHQFLKQYKEIKVIVSIGRLESQKRFDRLLRAFSLVKQIEQNVCLIILGEGPLKEELKSLAEQLKIKGSVDFVGFKMNPYAWMARADIFVLSSDYEGFPNVILEAMACGIPVISTDCPFGPNEIITDGRNGILVPMSNERVLANAMISLLQNKGMRERLAIEGIKRADNFRPHIIIPQYEKLF